MRQRPDEYRLTATDRRLFDELASTVDTPPSRRPQEFPLGDEEDFAIKGEYEWVADIIESVLAWCRTHWLVPALVAGGALLALVPVLALSVTLAFVVALVGTAAALLSVDPIRARIARR